MTLWQQPKQTAWLLTMHSCFSIVIMWARMCTRVICLFGHVALEQGQDEDRSAKFFVFLAFLEATDCVGMRDLVVYIEGKI